MDKNKKACIKKCRLWYNILLVLVKYAIMISLLR